MQRRKVLGLFGAAGFATLGPVSRSDADAPAVKPPDGPPRLSAVDLARRVTNKEFRFESIYAHEVEFRAVALIDRDVPLVQIKGMKGLYSKVHLYGGGRVEAGQELAIIGLIVGEGFGALIVWVRKCKYADAEPGAAADPAGA
jgi:hypothetical protein